MSQYHTINVGETIRSFGLLALADGSAITAGTVNYHLKALSGANAGKWWRDSDQTWQESETANEMTHQADGAWTIELASSPFVHGDVLVEYAKESGDLHIPANHRLLKVMAAPGMASGLPTVDADNHVAGVAGDVIGKVLGIGAGSIMGIGVWAQGESGLSLLPANSYIAPNNAGIAAILSSPVVDGATLPQALQIIAASAAGKVSGAGSGVETFIGLDGTTPRIIVTVDNDGNRTGVSYG